MTAAQKKNRERFIKVQAEAKKLKKKNPKLKHIEAIKKAWAILLHDTKASKKVKAVKVIKKHKKVSGVKKHTDTKSHNVKVHVISGVRKLSIEEIKFLHSEIKNAANYHYRPKILFGEQIVLKETKNGTPIKKWIVDSFEIANILCKELNQNKKFAKLKSKSV